jgi:hypothetical protein
MLEATHDSQKKRDIVFQSVEWWKLAATGSPIREGRGTQPAKIVIADPSIPSGDFRYSTTSFVLDPDGHWFSCHRFIGGGGLLDRLRHGSHKVGEREEEREKVTRMNDLVPKKTFIGAIECKIGDWLIG